jgi:hypothetical protein
MNKKNLLQLATYLLSGNLKAAFDMEDTTEWGSCPDNNELLFKMNEATTCGSVGCALGHGPYAGIEKYQEENWPSYQERAFGLDKYGGGSEFAWVFHESWARVDNTPEGAGKRILYLLKYGLPDNCDLQRNGLYPLSYTDLSLPQ